MVLVHVGYLVLPVFGSVRNRGSLFNRQQHSHATSCRHFQLGPHAPLPIDFPMPHPGQPQSGINPHLAPSGHQHPSQLHSPLNPLPPTPQFQDLLLPPFLPQALHQQYLLQQQILEAQNRRIMPPSSRRTPERMPHQSHRLRLGYEFVPALHVPPQPVGQQPRYLAEGTDWDLSVDAGLPPHQYHIRPLPQHFQHYLTSPRMHHFPRNSPSTQVVVHEIRNYPYPQLHLLALQGLNPSRHASAVRESYEVQSSQSHGQVPSTPSHYHPLTHTLTSHTSVPASVCPMLWTASCGTDLLISASSVLQMLPNQKNNIVLCFFFFFFIVLKENS
ncbi:E3 ubiquitin-protein ligase ARK2C-like isoform X3 [Oncorhynchus masou masou]|uniref:E3 ubiquitin-protein ligase ARK2C-like isoform X3 n=1 Tax=Oncorhynchus masou masou TaxID=90313 RepID=UPI003182C62D